MNAVAHYAAVIAREGYRDLVWRTLFDGEPNSGGTVNDFWAGMEASVVGNVGGTQIQTGLSGHGIRYTSSTADYFTNPQDMTFFDLTNAWTLGGWFYFDTVGTDTLLFRSDPTAPDTNLKVVSPARIQAGVPAGTHFIFSADNSIVEDSWNFVVLKYNGGNVARLHVNGVWTSATASDPTDRDDWRFCEGDDVGMDTDALFFRQEYVNDSVIDVLWEYGRSIRAA